MISNFQTWSGTVADGDNLCAIIAATLDIRNFEIKALTLQSEDWENLTFEFEPGKSAATMLSTILTIGNGTEGLGTHTITKMIARGSGNIKMNFYYIGQIAQ